MFQWQPYKKGQEWYQQRESDWWNQEINNNNADDDNNNNNHDDDNGILHENDREHPNLAAKVTCCFGSHFCSNCLSIPMRSQRVLLNLESTSDLDIRPTDLHMHIWHRHFPTHFQARRHCQALLPGKTVTLQACIDFYMFRSTVFLSPSLLVSLSLSLQEWNSSLTFHWC